MGKALLCLLLLLFPLTAEAQEHANVTRLSADSSGVVLVFQSGDYSVKQVAGGYDAISMPGLEHSASPGHPRLPLKGVLIGLPEATRAEIDVLDVQGETIPNVRITPVPTITRTEGKFPNAYKQYLEAGIYQSDDLYPGPVASIRFSGAMRGQPIAQVVFHPVQYNPVSEEAQVFTRIEVRVRFVPDGHRQKAAVKTPSLPDDDPYRAIMERTLINYSALR